MSFVTHGNIYLGRHFSRLLYTNTKHLPVSNELSVSGGIVVVDDLFKTGFVVLFFRLSKISNEVTSPVPI